MSIDQIASEALRLPSSERALPAESLWERLEQPFRTPCDMDNKSALSLALERDRQMQSGEIQPLSHEDLMARLRR
jgi:hypothetical protein